MDISTLLQQFEGLNHSDRVRRMVEIGKQSKGDETSRTIINNLASGTLYEQALSLETCYGSRDITIAKQALASTSRYLKKRALILIGLLGSDEDFLNALKSAPTYLQICSICRFRDARRHRQRLQVIEAFLEDLESTNRDPKLFQSLLPLGTRSILDRHLEGLIDHFSLLDWSHLAKYHPDVAQKALRDWIDRSLEDDHQLVTTINHVLTQWLAHEYNTDHAVALFKAGLKKISMARFSVKKLAAKRPREVFQIILDSDEDVGDEVLERMETKILRQIPLTQFLELFKRYPDVIDSWHAPSSFDELTFEQRKAVYKIVNVGWRNRGILTRLSLEKLPTEDRIKEARRHITNSKFVAKPEGKIKYIALLPWDEAMELQAPFLKSSEADTRSTALYCQIAAAKFDDSHLSDALQMALSRKNEKDPVKRDIMKGLVKIPPSRWKTAHLDDLEDMLRNLLDTSDTSTGTIYNMTALVTGILSFHPSWASKQLATIVRERGPLIQPFQLSGSIPVKDVMAIMAQEMSPVVDKLLKRKEGNSLRILASCFGTYTKYWTELLDVCEKVLNDPEMEDEHGLMLDILKNHLPRTWSRVIPSLLQDNFKSACSSSLVVRHVHLRQQRFLFDYLKAGEDLSRARTEALDILSTSKHGFWRWTPSQQDAFATRLLEEINDEDVETDKKAANIKQLSALAFIDKNHLINFANNDDKPLIQEAALKSLGKLDGNQGVPILVEALSDKRARIAIYALRTVLKTMSKTDVLSLLKSVPQTKVTVAKETLRLIGELETDEAFIYLLERGKENLHADVRLAIFRALLNFTDRDETWAFFRRTAEDPSPDLAKIVSTIPQNGLSTPAKESLLQLFLQLLAHPDPVVRLATLRRCNSDPLHDPSNILAPRLFELIHSPINDEGEAASIAIFKTYATSNIELIGETYRKLMSNREMLERFHGEYWIVAMGRKKKFHPVTHLILKVLKEDRFSVKRRVKLMFDALYWPDIKPYLVEIVPVLHADALVEAENAIEQNLTRWKRTKDSLVEAELEMGRSGDERARRLALALLIGGVDEEKGWKREEADRLERYKMDSSPLVAERAWEVTIDEESNELDGEDEDEADEKNT
ncbi:hypothetical protein EG329_011604 [Mollisiaceae sp. DMI_Dod_QoI]|nr:hypothetical protein EG329_011604 [Helotiales sp. DMI_Dod_QoI]